MNKKLCSLLLLLALHPLALYADFPHVNDDQIKMMLNSPQPQVINFWATWCQPCRVEIPALNRLKKKYDSVRFVGINVDEPENRGALKGFLKKFPIDYEIILRDGEDFENLAAVFDKNWKAGIPATFVYDGGNRVYSKIGPVDESELNDILAKIRQNSL